MKNKRKFAVSMLAATMVMSSFSGVLMADELKEETLQDVAEVVEETEAAEEEVTEETEVYEISDDTYSDTSIETSDEDVVFENVDDDAVEDGVVEEEGFNANYATTDISADSQAASLIEYKSGSCGDNLTYTLYVYDNAPNDPVKVTITGTGAMRNYKSSSESPFCYSSLKTFEIRSGVTSIGSYAFANCINLANYSLPASVTSIGDYAFYGCTSLSSYAFSYVTAIGNRAFANSGISSVVFGNKVVSCGSAVFEGCEKLRTVTYKSPITKVPDSMFSGCINLQTLSFDIDHNLTFGKYSFSGCTKLSNVTAPCYLEKELQTITANYKLNHSFEGVAYSKCSNCSYTRAIDKARCNTSCYWEFVDTDKDSIYETVYLHPVDATVYLSLNYSTLSNQSGIKNVIIKEGIKALPNSLLSNMPDLVSIKLPSDITAIPSGFCKDCEKLSSINIPEGVETIGSYAFRNDVSLVSVTLPSTLTTIDNFAFENIGIKSINIPEGVTKLNNYAFYNCHSLEKVVIPSTLANITYASFANCEKLKNVYIYADEPTYSTNTFMNSNNIENIYVTCKNKINFGKLASLVRILHTYDNNCDATCNVCGVTRTPKDHVYDADYDTKCNECGFERKIADPVVAFAARLYTTCLGRNPEKTGMEYWVKALKDGTAGSDAAYKFFFGTEFTGLKVSDDEYLNRLYRTFMGREADANGKSYWLGQIKNGSSRLDVFNGFVKSAEWKSICAEYGINPGKVLEDAKPSGVEAFATRLYTTCLGRNPDANGLKDWVDKLKSHKVTGTAAAHGFFFSKEFTSKNYSNDEYIKRLYRTFMGREADSNGIKYWQDKFKSGYTREQVFQGFAKSAEFASICKQYGILV